MAANLSISNTWAASKKKLEDFTCKPEIFLTVQNDLAENIKQLTKQFYDTVKTIEVDKPKEALPELIIDSFDDEQIWQQLELQNEEKCSMLISQVSKLLAVKDKLLFPLHPEENEESESPELGEGGDSDVLVSGESDSDYSQQTPSKKKITKKCKKNRKIPQRESTVVDDKFFKLRDMEAFLEQEETRGEADSDSGDESVDLFDDNLLDDESENDDDDVNNEAPSGPCYRDFFDPVDGEEVEESSDEESYAEESDGEKDDEAYTDDDNNDDTEVRQNKKGVRFADASSSDDSDEEKEGSKPKSSFETRQERLQKRIEQIHEEALGEKPWQLKGEVSATSRPQNSLLEEVLEFDMTTRPAPVITEQTTLKLEDIIRQRIKDKAWDDVERKAKPVEEPSEYKKKLVLDQEKSKLSLAQIYEKEYLKKQKEALSTENNDDGDDGDKEEPPEHAEIRKMMHTLFSQLDALSNYHFTPKPPAPEVKIITNLPAISVEEVAPVATSDATLLAPEEVKRKPRGGLLAKEERTDTDKKRERRKKKKHQKAKKIAQEAKEKELQKLNPGAGMKHSKQRAAKELEKATKEGRIKKLEESSTGHKAVKSSSAFFSQLQDEVTSLIKNKAQNLKRKKGQESQHSAKKLKL